MYKSLSYLIKVYLNQIQFEQKVHLKNRIHLMEIFPKHKICRSHHLEVPVDLDMASCGLVVSLGKVVSDLSVVHLFAQSCQCVSEDVLTIEAVFYAGSNFCQSIKSW